MDLSLSRDVIVMLVKKNKNNFVTLLENVPGDKLKRILTACCSKFGCGGNIVKDAPSPTILLQGDQKFNVEKAKDTIFSGMEIRNKDK